ncbi:MAG: AraC family transcriptional regulator [Betaproteobacteria bacterium]
MVKIGQAASIASVSYRPPVRYALDLEVLSVRELRRRASADHLRSVQRIGFHMLVCVTSGRCVHMVDFADIRCGAGSVLLMQPGQVQRFDPAAWEGWIVIFRPEFLLPLRSSAALSEFRAQGSLDSLPGHLRLGREDHAAVAECLARMHADGISGGADGGTNALLRHQLYAVLLRLFLLHGRREPPQRRSPVAVDRFKRFQAAVERDFTRDHRLASYARRLGCSQRSLTRATLDGTGRSAKAYLQDRIVLEAKRLLAHTAAPVASIADELGFAEATNFVKFFRRETGCAPGEFRRRQTQ